MKIVVIGGTGLIGSKVVGLLRRGGHDVIAASPSGGVNTYTGDGLDAALAGAETVIDLANAPDFADGPVLDFFLTAGRNLLAAEARAGVRRHIALTVVGGERLLDSGYLRAKLAQESLIRAFAKDHVILRATQFFEFLPAIAQQATVGDTVRLSPGLVQPIASDDLAEAVAELAFRPEVRGIVEIGGPEAFPMCDLVQKYLAAIGDKRHVVADADAPYFGAVLAERSLVPGPAATIAPTHFDDWFKARAASPSRAA
ncbi:MAG TPA: SDR family oxidoreductase [Reyranella sp.]